MQKKELYLRTVIFGVIDALVSNVGLLAGMDAAHTAHRTIVLTGIIYAFVEGFSMAVGNFLSEETVEEFEAKGEVSDKNAFSAGGVMFVVSVIAAFVPIFPYILFDNWMALAVSVTASAGALFVVGMISGRLARLSMMKHGVRMVLIGGAAIVIGMVVGVLVPA